ncbi:hypothetical protein [Clostridium sardiniense]|uniref:hypothetical protein n=1 Tax=Clostridium sardiniense TaxID=29369 RepID=UPI001FAE9AD5|nr:hypothetical protein [Clostridium sardiniense]MBM7834997.1 hypothetical protein [Clostridium sardiniense]
MNLELEEVYKRERAYMKAVRGERYKDYLIDIEKLGLFQCKVLEKRRQIIKKPVREKISIYTVFKFYINLGVVFRDKNKRYYSMEEVEQLIVKYYKENSIKYEID